MNSVLLKGKKLEIVFDLENTLIFQNVFTFEKKIFEESMKNNKDKELYPIYFKYSNKFLYTSFIIRQGIEEFINFLKHFCNLHIYTLALNNYANHIIKILESKLSIKFQKKVTRKGNIKGSQRTKNISEFKNENLNNKNTIIFDNNPIQWEKDVYNVIPSKFFCDREYLVYNIKENIKIYNNLTCLLNSAKYFYYHSLNKSHEKESIWKKQVINKIKYCPFFIIKKKIQIISSIYIIVNF